MTVFEKIQQLLTERGIAFKVLHHEATRTSEASAKARGESIEVGGKAIVMKVDDGFKLFVLSAALKIDSQRIKEHFHAKSIRFATPEELLSLTSLPPGSIPPFGRPIVDLDLYADGSIRRHETIAFNAGSLTDSIVMSTTDFLAAANPILLDFSRQA